MKNILLLICFVIILSNITIINKLYALNYNGPIKEITNPIKIEYKIFNGTLKGQNVVDMEMLGSRETQTTKGSISIKKNNNRTLLVEYVFQIVGDTPFKLKIYISPNGKIHNYEAEAKDYQGSWDKIKKSEIIKSGYKNVMELLVNTIIFDYSSSFVQGDTVVRYPFYDIINLWFNAEGNSRSEFQISDNFNFLDSIPKEVGGKLLGETCYNGRSAYVVEYNIDYKYQNYPSKSRFIMKGYQLIDKESGFYFHGRYNIDWDVDFGETLDSGMRNFDFKDYEKFDLNFQDSNCSKENITKSTTTTKKTNINNINKTIKDQLLELKNLFDEGLITKEVYEKKQLEILEQ